ncbi:MAG: UDP-N-acetylglucosamine 2-epimerase (non-hydrolyzing) [Alphaproteobacteria bacterium]|nr:UDP-N-acetylglucosamine 2-epimerase (non-hydrolyzing) [Alphaproteobacteria bacterium]
MKVVCILGARPNFIKHYAFQKACRSKGLECIAVHTGQHSDVDMSDIFFRQLGLDPPAYLDRLERLTPARDLGRKMVFIEDAIKCESPALVVVYGDVASTRAGALAASGLGVPVAHVEAGVRAGNMSNPEELNRRIAELCAHTLFPNIESARSNLLAEGFPEDDIFLTGDIMMDSLLAVRNAHGIEPSNGDYVLVTLHRAENTDDPTRLSAICETLMAGSRNIRFPVHPRTRAALECTDLWGRLLACGHIDLMPPQGYVETVRLIAGAERVLSDSGGVRREAYIFGKPVVSLIELIWVPEMIEAGWEFVAGADTERIRYGLETFTPPPGRPDIFGDGGAAHRMVDILLERYGGEAKRQYGS